MHKRNFLIFSLIIGVVLLIWFSVVAHQLFSNVLVSAEEIIRSYPISGIFIFTIVAALSAMFTFFSSVILVPIAIFVWGEMTTFFLLILGWFVGGVFAYYIGKHLGRRATGYFVPMEKINYYEKWISKDVSVLFILFWKLILPSEVPSFLLGIIRYPFLKYIFVVLFSELPFAFWVVYASQAFLGEQRLLFLLILIGGFILSGGGVYLFHQKLTRNKNDYTLK